MAARARVRGEIRLGTLAEMLLLFVFAYTAVQVWPAVSVRIRFANEMEVAANAPIHMDARQIKLQLLEAAQRFSLALVAEDLGVERNQRLKRTIVRARYVIPINFWPHFTYAWHVEDEVQAYLY